MQEAQPGVVVRNATDQAGVVAPGTTKRARGTPRGSDVWRGLGRSRISGPPPRRPSPRRGRDRYFLT
ncbi:hypothetical protein LSTR_LSTR015830 [Laodelphax striatellus]|uniref:Uncharacterized protein n=1 Tax=Laodelphax striatellus TaxID=195883 RepID=A0A482XEN9_LAOST|nr:hypothetical protein LSTR_LSTR015830 [Laodelphax striatellus]